MKGLKYDNGKLRWDLLPLRTIKSIVTVLTYGVKKYKPNSWQNIENAEDRYYASLLRHLESYRSGTTIDKESKLPHIYHVFCNIMFLVYLYDKKNNRSDIKCLEDKKTKQKQKQKKI